MELQPAGSQFNKKESAYALFPDCPQLCLGFEVVNCLVFKAKLLPVLFVVSSIILFAEFLTSRLPSFCMHILCIILTEFTQTTFQLLHYCCSFFSEIKSPITKYYFNTFIFTCYCVQMQQFSILYSSFTFCFLIFTYILFYVFLDYLYTHSV